MRKEKLYICVGANYRNGYDLAYVGDIHTLHGWLKILFPNADAVEYFNGYPSSEIISYIYANCGKRLERVKN